MARTHSSYSASPTRLRSPQCSPARRPSQDGSQYEMDLDALGLNSTFECTELEASHEPPVERVDTSEIEGPEDFTMNMTYWMTADLPLAHIKSRKEARAKISELRMDVLQERGEQLDVPEEGDQVVVEEDSRGARHNDRTSGSPTERANGTTDDRAYSTPASERSMENDEKVRSFLSALPDTDMEGALTGTPLHAPRNSFLQVPQSSPPKARSLQPTVEDYDTPRKPTEGTVIHHTAGPGENSEPDTAHQRIAELKALLEQSELASKRRITELETILSYTRSELEGSRMDNYRQNEKMHTLEQSMERQQMQHAEALASTEAKMKAREEALEAKMREFAEEMRLQSQAKLHSQHEEFELQIKLLEESNRKAGEEREVAKVTLLQAQEELLQQRKTNEGLLQELRDTQPQAPQSKQTVDESVDGERGLLSEQLSSVQARANELQSSLDKAIAEARQAREDAHSKETMRAAVEAKARSYTTRITELETHLQTARFEVECAQADIAAKQQLFSTNLDLNARLRKLHSELEAARVDLASSDQQHMQTSDLEVRIGTLLVQLKCARDDLDGRDQETLRHIEQYEQSEQRVNIAHGRIEGLEASVATLRQQLAEAHRDSSKARTDVERLEGDLEDANERLEDARAEANRRVADVEAKLSKMKESKIEAEKKVRELQAQREDLIEGHEAMMEDVRDKAEDAVRKAGGLLEHERAEKRRITKELKRSKEELETLRAAATQTEIEAEESEEDTIAPVSDAEHNAKDAEISTLRAIIRKQVSEMKTLRCEMAALKKHNQHLKATTESAADLQSTITSLDSLVSVLRSEKTSLQTRLAAQEEDFEAVNKAMDEKLAAVLSNVVKERAKTVVGKRDGQWAETMGKVQTERELLGKALMRQWGREEVGIAEEKRGEKQGYKYKYTQRA